MIHAIALRFGYVESSALSWFVFQPEFAFKTKKEAFHSLAEYLYQRYIAYQSKPKLKDCCKISRETPGNAFCSKCGGALFQSSFDYHNWIQDLEDYRIGTCDSSRYNSVDNPAGWDPANYLFGIPEKNMIIVEENGAEMLSYAVAELHPELKDCIHQEINDVFYTDYKKIIGK